MTVIFDKLNEDLIIRNCSGSFNEKLLIDFFKSYCTDYRVRYLKCISINKGKGLAIEVEYVRNDTILFAKVSGFACKTSTLLYYLLELVKKTGINSSNTIYRVNMDKEVYVYASDGIDPLKCLNLLHADSDGFYYFLDEKTYQNLYFD